MPTPTTSIKLYVVIDSDGNYAAGTDAESARTAYTETIQDIAEADGFRLVVVKLDVPLPVVMELIGTVPANDTNAELVSAV